MEQHPDSDPEIAAGAQRGRLGPREREARRLEIMGELASRLDKEGGTPRGGRAVSQSRIRLRTLLLPAFAIALFLHFGSRAGAPLGVHAAFTPGGGDSFAGPRVFSSRDGGAGDAARGPVRLEPGDVVGTTSGSPAVLELGKGSLTLEPGARALVASLMPPRVRLIGGMAVAKGRLRIVTAHGVLDLDEGEARLQLNASLGLVVDQVTGRSTLVAPGGTQALVAGETASSR